MNIMIFSSIVAAAVLMFKMKSTFDTNKFIEESMRNNMQKKKMFPMSLSIITPLIIILSYVLIFMEIGDPEIGLIIILTSLIVAEIVDIKNMSTYYLSDDYLLFKTNLIKRKSIKKIKVVGFGKKSIELYNGELIQLPTPLINELDKR